MQWSLKKTFLIPIGHVVGCGGINFAENKTIGKISWDIIHPDFQGKSLGTKLLKYRIEVLKTIPGIQKITSGLYRLLINFMKNKGLP